MNCQLGKSKSLTQECRLRLLGPLERFQSGGEASEGSHSLSVVANELSVDVCKPQEPLEPLAHARGLGWATSPLHTSWLDQGRADPAAPQSPGKLTGFELVL